MFLEGKKAVVFAAYGAISSAVARRLAREGAEVFLSGRDVNAVNRLAEEIRTTGGKVHAHKVDATDDAAVLQYVAALSSEGVPDLVFNGIGPRAADAEYAVPSGMLSLAKFQMPLDLIAGSQFITARACADHMAKGKGGSVVLLSASLTGHFVPFMAGITAACGAVEAMTTSLAAEYGPRNVRVNCIRAAAMQETRTLRETGERFARTVGASADSGPQYKSSLGRGITVDDTAASVAYLGTSLSDAISGQVLNVCAGELVS